jgi:hypothetical protein
MTAFLLRMDSQKIAIRIHKSQLHAAPAPISMTAVALLLPNRGPGTTAPHYLIVYQSLWQPEHAIRNNVVRENVTMKFLPGLCVLLHVHYAT